MVADLEEAVVAAEAAPRLEATITTEDQAMETAMEIGAALAAVGHPVILLVVSSAAFSVASSALFSARMEPVKDAVNAVRVKAIDRTIRIRLRAMKTRRKTGVTITLQAQMKAMKASSSLRQGKRMRPASPR